MKYYFLEGKITSNKFPLGLAASAVYFVCVIPEYRIVYRKLGRIKRLQGYEKLSKSGHIDIYARKNHIRLTIEYDTGATIRWKSLEKLLQSNVNICIAISHGNYNNNYAYEKNKKRVNRVFDEIYDFYTMFNNQAEIENLRAKKFWFGMVNLKMFEVIIF